MIRTFRATTTAWHLSLRAIRLLLISKESDIDRLGNSAINLNIIQNLAAAVEGSTRSLLINHIEYSNYNKDAYKNVDLKLKSIIDFTLLSLYKKSWSELIVLSNQLFPTKLKDYYSGDFRTISNLFQLRNVTANGGVIIKKIDKIPNNPELGYNSDEYTVDFDNKKQLTKYLLDEKLIASSILKQIEFWDYFNDDVTNHFRQASFNFINQAVSYTHPEPTRPY